MSTNNSTSNTRKKISSVTYKKSYPTFKEGLSDICDINKKVADIFTNIDFDKDSIIEDVYGTVVDLAAENCPNPETRENTLWQFSISANSVNIKTNQFLGIGWNIKTVPDKEGNTVTIYVTIFGNGKKEIDDLVENGYKENINVRSN
jgi:hypothetical protein